MSFIRWVDAYVVVCLRMLSTWSSHTKGVIIVCLCGLLLAGAIGLPATVALLVVGVLVLPVLNHDIKSAIDREYTKRK